MGQHRLNLKGKNDSVNHMCGEGFSSAVLRFLEGLIRPNSLERRVGRNEILPNVCLQITWLLHLPDLCKFIWISRYIILGRPWIEPNWTIITFGCQTNPLSLQSAVTLPSCMCCSKNEKANVNMYFSTKKQTFTRKRKKIKPHVQT